MRTVSLFVIFVLASFTGSIAQEQTLAPEPGQRVQVEAAGSAALVGTVVQADSTYLRLLVESGVERWVGRTISIPLDGVRRIVYLSPQSAVPAARVIPVQLARGQRVRVTAPSLGIRQQVGRVQTWSGDTLEVRQMRDGPVVTIPALDITRLEVAQISVRSGTAQGAGYGAVTGLVIGGLVGYIAGESNCKSGFLEFCVDKPSAAAGLGVVGMLVGGLVGAAAGSRWHTRSEAWVDVPIERVRVNVAPHGDGLGLRVNFAF